MKRVGTNFRLAEEAHQARRSSMRCNFNPALKTAT
jgi:hypothetical protein